jgi:methionyl-tRNA formyltransferase
MGVLGVHPALLPQNRGRHPLIWTIVLGLKESGLTFFFMDESVDSGPILSQKRFKISNNETATTLYKKIKDTATMQIADLLPQLSSRNYVPIIQETNKPNYWRKRFASDGIIDWRMNEPAILNLIRALTKPYPGAQFRYKDQFITVWDAHEYMPKSPSNIEPGKIIRIIDSRPVIKCYDGAVVINTYEPNINFSEGEYIK